MKPLVLIDFDHTLGNTQRLKHEFPRLDDAIAYVTNLPDNSYAQYLYPDASIFIKYVNREYQPAIFTEGPPDFQQSKISKSGLATLIPPTFIFIYPPNEKIMQLPRLITKHPIATMIDDKPEVIDAATRCQLSSIRLNRGDHQNIPSTHPATLTVKSLQEIIDQDLLPQVANLVTKPDLTP